MSKENTQIQIDRVQWLHRDAESGGGYRVKWLHQLKKELVVVSRAVP